MSKSKAPTQDGEKIKVNQLNLGNASLEEVEEIEEQSRVARFFRNISLFAAGMYTGVGCSGTPHKYHSYDRDRDDGPI